MKDSKIAWTDDTVNFWIGCDKVSEACDNCYAETIDAKFKFGGAAHWGKEAPRYLRLPPAAKELVASEKKALKEGKRRRVFINSMSDFFEDREDLSYVRGEAFAYFEAARMLDIQLLTKRPQNILKMVPEHWKERWPKHVWIGTTVEMQKWARVRIPHLLTVPAPIHWLSCEPLLGPLDIAWHLRDMETGINWVVAGGESGKKFTPLDLKGFHSLRVQCQMMGCAFFAKQDSGPKPGQRGRIPDEDWIQQFPAPTTQQSVNCGE